MTRRDEILTKISSVPALPAAVTEAITLLEDPETPIKTIARAIEHDPGLTANVLKRANSASMGMARTVSSVQQAIVRLGAIEIVKMAIHDSVAPIMRQPTLGYQLRSGELWEHAVAVMVATEQIAIMKKIETPSDASTAGLLIDVGKLVLGQFVELEIEPIRDLAFQQHLSFEEAEREALGIDHAEVGAHLLDQWNLPDAIVDVVRWHHEPTRVSPDHRLVADLVHAADQIITISGIGGGDDGLTTAPTKHPCRDLTFGPARLRCCCPSPWRRLTPFDHNIVRLVKGCPNELERTNC